MAVSVPALIERFCPVLDEDVVRAVADSGGDSEDVVSVLQEFFKEALIEQQKTHSTPSPAESSADKVHAESQLGHGDRTYGGLDSVASLNTPRRNEVLGGDADDQMLPLSYFATDLSSSRHGSNQQAHKHAPFRRGFDRDLPVSTTSMEERFQFGLLSEASRHGSGPPIAAHQPAADLTQFEHLLGIDSSAGQKRKLEAMGSGESYKANEPVKKSLHGTADLCSGSGYGYMRSLRSGHCADAGRRQEDISRPQPVPDTDSFRSNHSDFLLQHSIKEAVSSSSVQRPFSQHKGSLHMQDHGLAHHDNVEQGHHPVRDRCQERCQRISQEAYDTITADRHQLSKELFMRELGIGEQKGSSAQSFESDIRVPTSRAFIPVPNFVTNQQAPLSTLQQDPDDQRHSYPDRSVQAVQPELEGQPPQSEADHGIARYTEHEEKILYILRGCPGSGKSTLAKTLRGPNGVVLSTDDFFVRNGRYEFDPYQLGRAHEWNQNRALRAMRDEISPVVIDNTNTQAWEMKPYVTLGKDFQYEIRIKEPSTWWKWRPSVLAEKNTHGVPEDKIRQMIDRFERSVTVDSILCSTEPRRGRPSSDRNGRNQRHFMSSSVSRYPRSSLRQQFGESLPEVRDIPAPVSRKSESAGRPVSTGCDRERDERALHGRMPEKLLEKTEFSSLAPVQSRVHAVSQESEQDICGRHVQLSTASSLEAMPVTHSVMSSAEQELLPVPSAEERSVYMDISHRDADSRVKSEHISPCVAEMGDTHTTASVTSFERHVSDDSSVRLKGAAATLSWLSDLPSFENGDYCVKESEAVTSVAPDSQAVSRMIAQESTAVSSDSLVLAGKPADALEYTSEDQRQAEITPGVSLASRDLDVNGSLFKSMLKAEHSLSAPVQVSAGTLTQVKPHGLTAFAEDAKGCGGTAIADAAKGTLCFTRADSSQRIATAAMEESRTCDDAPDPSFGIRQQCRSLSSSSVSSYRSVKSVSLAPSFMYKRKLPSSSSAGRALSMDSAAALELSTDSPSDMLLDVLSRREATTLNGETPHETSHPSRSSLDSLTRPIADQEAHHAGRFSSSVNSMDGEGLIGESVDGDLNVINQDIVSWLADSATADQIRDEGSLGQNTHSLPSPRACVRESSSPFATALPSETGRTSHMLSSDFASGVEEPNRVAKGNELAALRTAFPKENELAALRTAFPKENELAALRTAFPKENELAALRTAFPKENELAALRTAFPLHSTEVLLAALAEAGHDAAQAGVLILDDPDTYPAAAVSSCAKLEAKTSGTSVGSAMSVESGITSVIEVGSSPREGNAEPGDVKEETNPDQLIKDEEFARQVDAELNRGGATLVASPLAGSSANRPLDLTFGGGSLRKSPQAASKAAKGNSSSVDTSKSSDPDTVVMELPMNVALQLVKIFGEVDVDLVPENLSFPLSTKLARNLYRQWVNQLRTAGHNVDESASRQRQEQEDKKMARRLAVQQDMDEISAQRNQPRPAGPQLADIMGEQMAEQLQDEAVVAHKPQLRRGDFATHMKRKQLCDRFPRLPEDLLDDIFAEEQYDLDKTIVQICDLVGEFPLVPAKEESQPSAPPCSVASAASTTETRPVDASGLVAPTAPSPSGFSGIFQDMTTPKYDDYRAEERLYAERQKYYSDLAQEYRGKGSHAIAEHYSREATRFGEKKQEARRLAMQAICARQTLEGEDTIDLHQLHVDEALLFLESALVEWQQKGHPYLTVITGRGLHSQGHRPRIKPAVINFLNTRNLRYDMVNVGCIRIHLR